jgi:hypothetical protein
MKITKLARTIVSGKNAGVTIPERIIAEWEDA